MVSKIPGVECSQQNSIFTDGERRRPRSGGPMGFEPQRHAGTERHGGPMLPLGAFVSLWFTLSHYQTGTQEKAWGRGWKIPVFPEFVPDLPKTFLDAPEFVPDGPEFLPDRP